MVKCSECQGTPRDDHKLWCSGRRTKAEVIEQLVYEYLKPQDHDSYDDAQAEDAQCFDGHCDDLDEGGEA